MFYTITLLIGIGIVCLISTVIALIFGVMAFANNKTTKFIWLGFFLLSLIGLIICVVITVQKTVNAVSNFTHNTISQFENFSDSLSNYQSTDVHQANSSSQQIQLLKSYLPADLVNNKPEQFYTYLGFKDYYRYPLIYPFSIHSNNKENGELYNELNVTRFDENDNEEIYLGIDQIHKIAFDKNYLLIEQEINSTRTDKLIYHYILYDFKTDKKEEFSTKSKLLELAKQKGYGGSDTLMTLEHYHSLF